MHRILLSIYLSLSAFKQISGLMPGPQAENEHMTLIDAYWISQHNAILHVKRIWVTSQMEMISVLFKTKQLKYWKRLRPQLFSKSHTSICRVVLFQIARCCFTVAAGENIFLTTSSSLSSPFFFFLQRFTDSAGSKNNYLSHITLNTHSTVNAWLKWAAVAMSMLAS